MILSAIEIDRIIRWNTSPERAARFIFGPMALFHHGFGDPHFPAGLAILIELGVIE